MTLRDDVRQHFEREASVFPAPAGLTQSVAAEASRDASGGGHGLRPAAIVAAALSVAIVAGLVVIAAFRHTPTAPAPVGSSAPGRHGIVIDADTIDGSNGWALLGQCPATQGPADVCQYWVESTHDGGATWTSPVKLATFPLTDGDAPRHIHFANASDGFAYGNGVAFGTRDGGAHWSRLFADATGIVAIEGRGPVWAVEYPCAKGTQCSYRVLVSADGGQTWTAAAALPSGFAPRVGVAFGSAGLVMSGYGVGDMAVTRDLGRAWTVLPGKCLAEAISNYVATPDGKEIWQYCGEPPTIQSTAGLADFLFVSEDGGTTWHRATSPGIPTVGAVLVAPKPGTALLVTSTEPMIGSRLLISQDAGATWTAVASAGEFTTVTSARNVVWAVDSQYAVWTSTDGGLTWSRPTSQP